MISTIAIFLIVKIGNNVNVTSEINVVYLYNRIYSHSNIYWNRKIHFTLYILKVDAKDFKCSHHACARMCTHMRKEEIYILTTVVTISLFMYTKSSKYIFYF